MSYWVSGSAPALTLNETDTVQSVLQNIAVILCTRQGEVPMYRDFGMNMDFVDRPLPVAERLLKIRAREAIEAWEPRAEVLDVRVDADEEDPGVLLPTVEVEIHG